MIELHATPLFERIYVLVDVEDTTTASGLIIPKESQDMVATGIVLKMGPLAKMAALVTEGAHVMFNKNSGLPLTIEGVEVRLMMVNDLLSLV